MMSYERILSFRNGAIANIASLENYELLDGTQFSWALLDETKDTREEAIKDVIVGRMRQKALFVADRVYSRDEVEKIEADENGEKWIGEIKLKSFNPMYIFTSPAKVEWLNQWFDLSGDYAEIVTKLYNKEFYHRKTDLHNVVICTAFSNQQNLPDGYIDRMFADFAGDTHKIDRYIYGSPVSKQGEEFYHMFDKKHIGAKQYNPDLALHFFFDFNVIPYLYVGVAQIEYVDDICHVNMINEFPMEHPNNNSSSAGKRLRGIYQDHKAGSFVYGDASGKGRSTHSLDAMHNYDYIEMELGYMPDGLLMPNWDRVLNKNPSVVARRDFVNKILGEGLPIRINIDPKCKRLIADMEFCTEGVDGGKRKVVHKDATGLSYQKFGHAGDGLEYMLIAAFEDFFVI